MKEKIECMCQKKKGKRKKKEEEQNKKHHYILSLFWPFVFNSEQNFKDKA